MTKPTVTSQQDDRKKKYEEKRVFKPVSFNSITDAEILKVLSKKAFCYSEWVKNVLTSFNPAEIALLKEDLLLVPASLVEHSIENGYFDLDEYLRAKGLKTVNINSKANTQTSDFHSDGLQEIEDVSQEYYFQ